MKPTLPASDSPLQRIITDATTLNEPTVSQRLDEAIKAYPKFAARTDKDALFKLSKMSFELGAKKQYPAFDKSNTLRWPSQPIQRDVTVPYGDLDYRRHDVDTMLANCFADNADLIYWEDFYENDPKSQSIFMAVLFETELFVKLTTAQFLTPTSIAQFRQRAAETLENYTVVD